MKELRKQGSLALVLLAVPLAGCGPDTDDTPQPMSRAQYDSLQDCIADWRTEDECEPLTEGGGTPAHGGMGRLLWWGPYYTQSGRVYHYDGRVSERAGFQPRHASAVTQDTLAPRQIQMKPGRYAATARARGGFGGTGRSGSGGG